MDIAHKVNIVQNIQIASKGSLAMSRAKESKGLKKGIRKTTIVKSIIKALRRGS